ncbi:flavin reductase family protein [Acuticoccus mangrovi]|uniref:Flavin reductase family protein n=1 Tax=Acuticoccus mangrovi TaxID=2796142 RepID=A0A934IS75_9HYPH|nr:flavin reductase family protein [Acuticoccus mangrovi]MBJ3777262.1 flavin reductase family protein [Acuticoccus mangrovi]
MATFDFSQLEARERYKLLCAAVIPRPVAWITTLNAEGGVNAAPFSFFNVFADEPPLLIVGIGRRPESGPKDTVLNAEREGAFTVNLADTALAEKMVATAADFPPEIGEAEAVGLAVADGVTQKIPYLKDAPVVLECSVYEIRYLDVDRALLMGKVSALIARDGLFDLDTRRLNVPHWDPVARLFATSYAPLGEAYSLPIPDWRTITGPKETSE